MSSTQDSQKLNENIKKDLQKIKVDSHKETPEEEEYDELDSEEEEERLIKELTRTFVTTSSAVLFMVFSLVGRKVASVAFEYFTKSN